MIDCTTMHTGGQHPCTGVFTPLHSLSRCVWGVKALVHPMEGVSR